MSKLVAVWGSSGAGKSLISCAIANKLTAKNRNVIVVNSDRITPMLGVYLPFLELKPEYSLGRILSGSDSNISNKIHIHKSNNNLAFMALCPGENNLVYQSNWLKTYIDRLLDMIAQNELADYVIVDCTSNALDNALTLYVLEKADHVITVVSPDNQGVSFLKSQLPILSSGSFKVNEYIRVVNNGHRYSPTEKIQQDYGCEFAVPHCKEAYTKFIAGQLLGKFIDINGAEFEKAIKKIVERVR